MASATARLTFTFHLHTSHSQLSPSRSKTHLPISLPQLKKPIISPLQTLQKLQFTSKCIDVSQEDKPTSEEPNLISTTTESESESEPPVLEEVIFDKRRLEEQFAVLNTGIYECRSCGYLYDESSGDPSYPIPPGLQFDKLPEDWRCPTCGAAQSFFQSKSVEIAGFAQNQQYGLGGNALTSGQKLILIYGSLLLFFALFLSGYFLQ
ncbi:Rubredoxin-like domain [Macleaya cordata]|uniref:Rubredoxin-like domain n=1 Tax=Macleaya cordata TaxID=56857 RepID=A0A200R1M2_MACCD|nr:Rubredoxin-like domain [Macleaya cordata]